MNLIHYLRRARACRSCHMAGVEKGIPSFADIHVLYAAQYSADSTHTHMRVDCMRVLADQEQRDVVFALSLVSYQAYCATTCSRCAEQTDIYQWSVRKALACGWQSTQHTAFGRILKTNGFLQISCTYVGDFTLIWCLYCLSSTAVHAYESAQSIPCCCQEE